MHQTANELTQSSRTCESIERSTVLKIQNGPQAIPSAENVSMARVSDGTPVQDSPDDPDPGPGVDVEPGTANLFSNLALRPTFLDDLPGIPV